VKKHVSKFAAQLLFAKLCVIMQTKVVDVVDLRFLLDDEQIDFDETIADLELVDDDQVEMLVLVLGNATWLCVVTYTLCISSNTIIDSSFI
jgi:hypothetical protein